MITLAPNLYKLETQEERVRVRVGAFPITIHTITVSILELTRHFSTLDIGATVGMTTVADIPNCLP
jgi:hypothetical protein